MRTRPSLPCGSWSRWVSTKRTCRAEMPAPNRDMAELRLAGKLASGGFAWGPLALIRDPVLAARRRLESPAEGAALRQAIAGAIDELADLAARAEGDGADILAFQMAMLDDEALAASALA